VDIGDQTFVWHFDSVDQLNQPFPSPLRRLDDSHETNTHAVEKNYGFIYEQLDSL
jgi:hypothetical protein